jgi:hypothetical protein
MWVVVCSSLLRCHFCWLWQSSGHGCVAHDADPLAHHSRRDPSNGPLWEILWRSDKRQQEYFFTNLCEVAIFCKKLMYQAFSFHDQFGSDPFGFLLRVAPRYGPLVSLRLGSIPAILLNSHESMDVVLRKHGHLTGDRPTFECALLHLTKDEKGHSGQDLVLAQLVRERKRDDRRNCGDQPSTGHGDRPVLLTRHMLSCHLILSGCSLVLCA